MRTLSECDQSFQNRVGELAEEYGKTPEFVYDLWRTYAATCADFDQSPVWFEFINWNKSALST